MPTLTIQQALALAAQNYQGGHFTEAEALYRQILSTFPDHVDALNNLALTHAMLGRRTEAIAGFQRVLEIQPDFGTAAFNLANTLKDVGRVDEAILAYRRLLEFQPHSIEVLNNLGAALAAAAQYLEAIGIYRRALRIAPESVVIHVNLGCAHSSLKQWEEAVDCFRKAISLAPNCADAYANLAKPYYEMSEPREALACSLEALQLNPRHRLAQLNAATAWQRIGDFENAERAFQRVLQQDPGDAVAHVGLGMLQWLLGRYREGWAGMEWRWRDRVGPEFQRRFTAPRWNGDSEANKTVFIHSEQGLGDTVQFFRYLPLLCQRAAPSRVIFECPREMSRLLAENWRFPNGTLFVSHGDDSQLPTFDTHLPLLSAPHVLGLHSPLAMTAPYLRPDPELRALWENRLASVAGFRVGLVSTGNPTQVNNNYRSIPASKFLRLFQIPGVSFYRLQVGSPPPDHQSLIDSGMIDLTEHITDFADTAAFMGALDLIITTDTVTPHLAGALGLPVWTLLSFVPDWRWGLESETTQWYPTMRLFRQPSLGDWDSVIERVTEELRHAITDRSKLVP